MTKRIEEYKKHNLPEPKLVPNVRVIKIEDNEKFNPMDCKAISLLPLVNLEELRLNKKSAYPNKEHQIGPEGCKYLSQGQFPKLRVLLLGSFYSTLDYCRIYT